MFCIAQDTENDLVIVWDILQEVTEISVRRRTCSLDEDELLFPVWKVVVEDPDGHVDDWLSKQEETNDDSTHAHKDVGRDKGRHRCRQPSPAVDSRKRGAIKVAHTRQGWDWKGGVASSALPSALVGEITHLAIRSHLSAMDPMIRIAGPAYNWMASSLTFVCEGSFSPASSRFLMSAMTLPRSPSVTGCIALLDVDPPIGVVSEMSSSDALFANCSPGPSAAAAPDCWSGSSRSTVAGRLRPAMPGLSLASTGRWMVTGRLGKSKQYVRIEGKNMRSEAKRRHEVRMMPLYHVTRYNCA